MKSLRPRAYNRLAGLISRTERHRNRVVGIVPGGSGLLPHFRTIGRSMSQPARFAARTKILRDHTISEGARLLYLFIDDELRGAQSGHLNRKASAQLIGICEREWTYRIRVLENAGYLMTNRRIKGNSYVLILHGRAPSKLHADAARTCTGVHIHPLEQETQEPPTPLRENCPECSGAGLVRKTYRGQGVVERCGCTRERRSA